MTATISRARARLMSRERHREEIENSPPPGDENEPRVVCCWRSVEKEMELGGQDRREQLNSPILARHNSIEIITENAATALQARAKNDHVIQQKLSGCQKNKSRLVREHNFINLINSSLVLLNVSISHTVY